MSLSSIWSQQVVSIPLNLRVEFMVFSFVKSDTFASFIKSVFPMTLHRDYIFGVNKAKTFQGIFPSSWAMGKRSVDSAHACIPSKSEGLGMLSCSVSVFVLLAVSLGEFHGENPAPRSIPIGILPSYCGFIDAVQRIFYGEYVMRSICLTSKP